MKWRAGTLAVLVAVMFAGACVGLREPEIRLENVRLGNLGLQGGTLVVSLGVVNPNRFAIQAGELTYELDLWEMDDRAQDSQWIPLARGTFDRGIRVEARDSARVEVPVEFRYRDAGVALRSILAHGTLDYRLSGTIQVEQPLRRQLPYRHAGTVSLDGSE